MSLDDWTADLRSAFPDWGTEEARTRWTQDRDAIAVGQPVRGRVVARAPFGVWLDIGVGHPALLLVVEMPDMPGPVSVESYPPLGAILDAVVLRLGPSAEISLSQRRITDDAMQSWHEATRRFPIGARVDVTVTRVEPFGVFVTLPGSATRGLIMVTEFEDGPRSFDISDYPPVGSHLTAVVVDHVEHNQQIRLSTRASRFARAPLPRPTE